MNILKPLVCMGIIILGTNLMNITSAEFSTVTAK